MATTRKRNHYQLIGVPRKATVDQIKEVYRDIARLYHPDSNFYDEIIDAPISTDEMGVFKDITAAYNVLIHEEKRREYDRGLPPELDDWDVGDERDDDGGRSELTEREKRARETAHNVKPDLVGAGRVIRGDGERKPGFGARVEEEDHSGAKEPGILRVLKSLISETLGGHPTLGQTIFVVLGLTFFGVGIVFIILYMLKR